jgi:hypothetical protein
MARPTFQPAPRPRPRTSPEEAQQLAAATGDLGFTRTSTVLEAGVDAPTVAPIAAIAQMPKSPIAPAKGVALKFEVPDEVWVALRQEALNRRVTVKYLVLEALAAKGYKVDLSAVPEDGRRIR